MAIVLLSSGIITMLMVGVPVGTQRRLPQPLLRADCLRPPTPVLRLSGSARRTVAKIIYQLPDSDPDKADAYFWLATYWRARAEGLARRSHCSGSPLDPRHAPALRKTERQSMRRWRLSALRYYLEIARGRAFARFRRLDEVLYHLAALLFQFERPQLAYHFLVRLFTDHPWSPYIARAYLSLADDEARREHTVMALANYVEGARRGGPALRGYALYKTAWCWLQQGDAYRALAIFVSLIEDARLHAISAPGAKLLAELARRDAVLAFSQLGNLHLAQPFLSRLARRR